MRTTRQQHMLMVVVVEIAPHLAVAVTAAAEAAARRHRHGAAGRADVIVMLRLVVAVGGGLTAASAVAPQLLRGRAAMTTCLMRWMTLSWTGRTAAGGGHGGGVTLVWPKRWGSQRRLWRCACAGGAAADAADTAVAVAMSEMLKGAVWMTPGTPAEIPVVS
jgi:hypothetical protein